MEQLFCFCLHFWVISLSVGEKVLHEKGFFTKYILLQSKAPLFIAYTFAQKMFICLPILRQETPFYVPRSFRCIYWYYETKFFEKKKNRCCYKCRLVICSLYTLLKASDLKTHHPVKDEVKLYTRPLLRPITLKTIPCSTKQSLHKQLRKPISDFATLRSSLNSVWQVGSAAVWKWRSYVKLYWARSTRENNKYWV